MDTTTIKKRKRGNNNNNNNAKSKRNNNNKEEIKEEIEIIEMQQGFEPVIGKDPHTLILGMFPSKKSRSIGII